MAMVGPAAADFSIVSDSGESLLEVGAARTLQVRFTPQGGRQFGAALQIRTDVDAHPVAVGMIGQATEEPLVSPAANFFRVRSHAVLAIPSQLGTKYSLLRSADLRGAFSQSLFTVQGTGAMLYLTDPEAFAERESSFYRVRASRD